MRRPSLPADAARPHTYRSLTNAIWPSLLHSYDQDAHASPVEFRHPFLDVRILHYLLAIPPIPWSIDKELLRRAMRGALPDRICRRPKTYLAGDPIQVLLRQSPALVTVRAGEALLDRFVNREALPAVGWAEDGDQLWTNLRPVTLQRWLESLGPGNHTTQEEAYHGIGR
jgi:asparagine synthase (glutamine-hydrolysing)